MKKIFLILLVIFVCLLPACTEGVETTDIQAKAKTRRVQETVTCGPSPALEELYSHDELTKRKNDASAENDTLGLYALEYYYIPAYAEKWCELLKYNLYDENNFNVLYKLKDAEKDTQGDLTLSYNRSSSYDQYALFQQLISGSNAIPHEACEGVYYNEVYNPGDNGALSLMQFHWMYDGYYFMMQVYPELMEQIRENDPEALKGALFELERVEL